LVAFDGIVFTEMHKAASGTYDLAPKRRTGVIGRGTMRSAAATVDDLLSAQPENIRQGLTF
jgi:hypothetical protein